MAWSCCVVWHPRVKLIYWYKRQKIVYFPLCVYKTVSIFFEGRKSFSINWNSVCLFVFHLWILLYGGLVYPLLSSDSDGFMQNLYNINVRKVILMGLPPVGCAPHFLEEYGSQTGECIDYINNVVIEFNYALRHMSNEFISQHPDSMISYCDTFEGSVDILNNRERYGEHMNNY